MAAMMGPFDLNAKFEVQYFGKRIKTSMMVSRQTESRAREHSLISTKISLITFLRFSFGINDSI